MRYWSTTSPAGCVHVRVMVVGSGEELLKAVGEDGIITTTTKQSHITIVLQYYVCVFTSASDSITSVSLVTGTGETALSVGTGSCRFRGTVVSTHSTLIDIYIINY